MTVLRKSKKIVDCRHVVRFVLSVQKRQHNLPSLNQLKHAHFCTVQKRFVSQVWHRSNPALDVLQVANQKFFNPRRRFGVVKVRERRNERFPQVRRGFGLVEK